MRIGMFIAGSSPGRVSTVDEVIANAQRAESLGLATGWVPHVPWSLDALTAIALAGYHTSRIELGTAVVPTWSRHPYGMAQHALSTQAACKGRLLLGIGPSHQSVAENWYGAAYAGVIHHVRDYVGVLEACFAAQADANASDHGPGGMGGRVQYSGERYPVESLIDVPGASPVPIFLAALAPLMLKLAGQRAAGTITWMGNIRTHAEHIVPRLEQAATEAGRPMPRIVAGIPVAVCDDDEQGREMAGKLFGSYGNIPAYARMLERGGAQSPLEVVITGNDKHVAERIRAYESVGVSDFCAMVFEVRPGDCKRTEELLASI
jgi:F420-dependent oxidoreductase-like protein